jgi:hypothetical protein
VVTAGTLSDYICAAWDFFPTFCELAGVAIPEVVKTTPAAKLENRLLVNSVGVTGT